MTTSDAYTMASTLYTNVNTLKTLLNTAANQTEIDDVSQQSWYGLPDAIGDDLTQAIGLIALITAKCNTVISPTTQP